jgi:hypothetical protein
MNSELEQKRRRNKDEVDLIFEFEMEHGNEENWPDDVHKEFDKKWNEIQKRYRNVILWEK